MSTLDDFFGPTEDDGGTGVVTRLVNGELTNIVVDKEAHEKFLAEQQRAEEEAEAEFWRTVELVEQVNS